jgi:hypothetical protein
MCGIVVSGLIEGHREMVDSTRNRFLLPGQGADEKKQRNNEPEWIGKIS